MLKLSGIFIYPIKGLGGIGLQKSTVERRGLRWDRRWLLVDEKGKFLTQRSHPKMALLQPSFEEEYLVIKPKDGSLESLSIPTQLPDNLEHISVTVWKDTCEAVLIGKKYNQWFSTFLNIDCRLVFMPDSTHRAVDPIYAKEGEIVSFADGYPILIAGERSLADLNKRLEVPVPMNRFRPNLVFSGGEPFEEDTWGYFKIGDEASFRGTKPCARCQVPTIDQDTGEMGKEPMKTMNTFRRKGKKVLFGLNVCWDLEHSKEVFTEVKIGDQIEIL